MKKTVTVFGIISGVILSIMVSIGGYMMTHNPGSGAESMWVGYAAMLLSFIFIFLAIKSYRDNQGGGTVSFGKAFMVGFWVALIGSVFYTITWAIIFKNFYPSFMTDMTSRQLANMEKAGKTAVEIAKEAKRMEGMNAMYDTWPGLIGFTMLEVLPVGVLVALVSAAILKRKQPTVALA